jgi:hypothetical protein
VTARDTDCPVNLHYDDPRAPRIDPTGAVAAGRRLGRRRVRNVALAAAAMVGLAAVSVPHVLGDPTPAASTDPLDVLRADPDYANNPPIADITVISRNKPEHWTAMAWASAHDVLCTAWARVPADANGALSQDVTCHTYRELMAGPTGSPTLSSKPLPQSMVNPSLPNGDEPVIGYVRGPARTVEVTMFDVTTTIDVIPLYTGGSTRIGVYLGWLPLRGHNEYGTTYITHVVARDAAGNVIAEIR